MRVLHILDHSLPLHSGYAFRSAEIIRQQRDFGWEVEALTGPKQDMFVAEKQLPDEEQYHRSRYSGIYRALPSIALQYGVISILRRRIMELAGSRHFDVLHAHSPSLNGLAALVASRKLNLPVVYEMRASWEDAAVDHGTSRPEGFRYRLTRSSETSVLTRADHITTICEGLKDEICSRGIACDKVTVIPNAVDVDRFRPLPVSGERLKRDRGMEDRFVLVFCGSFYSYEGLDLLLDAVASVVSDCPELLVCLAGGGEEDESLRERVAATNLQRNVTFLGRVPQSEVVNLYNLADICVFPRHRMKLTDMVTPLKPLEAMSTGSVVLASDVGGHQELVENEKTGFLFPADSADALGGAILDLAKRQDLSKIGKQAREFVARSRTWESSVGRYRSVYESIRGK